MRSQRWDVEAVVASMVEQKRSGCRDFEFAFARALKQHPPRSMDSRQAEPWEEMDLFHQDVFVEPSVLEFTRQALDDAWHGRNRGVAGFSLEALFDSVDESSSAKVAGDFRMAA